MTFGYPLRPTVRPGETVELSVDSHTMAFDFPGGWAPGAYVVSLDSSGSTSDARSGRALLVVRPRVPVSRLLVVLPLFTYHAYNVGETDPLDGAQGSCLYTGAREVSLLRPGGGVGGHLWDECNQDAYDPGTPRHTFAHWDAKALRWLTANGYGYDLCTDLDLHDGTLDLHRYRAVCSFGHHEYWTREMRESIDQFVSDGGNVAFFGGNTMWFRVTYDPQRRTISRDGCWNDEWKTTGVTYARGGGRWIGRRPRTEFVVPQPGHWIFDGLDVRRGETFGADCALAGYECDGVPSESDLDVLAVASLEPWPQRDQCGERAPDGHAALGVRQHGKGQVFTASTADWARALAREHPAATTITVNVLDRFLRGG